MAGIYLGKITHVKGVRGALVKIADGKGFIKEAVPSFVIKGHDINGNPMYKVTVDGKLYAVTGFDAYAYEPDVINIMTNSKSAFYRAAEHKLEDCKTVRHINRYFKEHYDPYEVYSYRGEYRLVHVRPGHIDSNEIITKDFNELLFYIETYIAD